MLTVSIPETLTMDPHAWSAWDDNAMLNDGMAQWSNCNQWRQDGDHPFQYETPYYEWGLDPTISFGQPFTMMETVLPKAEQQEPLKLPVGSGDSKVPSTAFASPLRVPLPKPLAISEEPSNLVDLPPGLEDFFIDMTSEELAEQGEKTEVVSPLPGFPTASTSMLLTAAYSQKPALLTSAAPCDDHAPPGISITPTDLGKLIRWEIPSFQCKMQGNNGRPLVSPPFSACGLPNLRLMVSMERDVSKSKSAKGKNSMKAAAKHGPLAGSLKLKADCLEGCATVLKFNLSVGAAKIGPFMFDFSQQAVHGPEDLGIDWLGQVDSNTGNIHVGVELLEV